MTCALRAFFSERRADVDAAWVVPSAAAHAPVRVGLLYTPARAPTHYEMYDDVTAALATVLGRDVEVVDLRRAAPAMARSILADGTLAFERAPGLAAAFDP